VDGASITPGQWETLVSTGAPVHLVTGARAVVRDPATGALHARGAVCGARMPPFDPATTPVGPRPVSACPHCLGTADVVGQLAAAAEPVAAAIRFARDGDALVAAVGVGDPAAGALARALGYLCPVAFTLWTYQDRYARDPDVAGWQWRVWRLVTERLDGQRAALSRAWDPGAPPAGGPDRVVHVAGPLSFMFPMLGDPVDSPVQHLRAAVLAWPTLRLGDGWLLARAPALAWTPAWMSSPVAAVALTDLGPVPDPELVGLVVEAFAGLHRPDGLGAQDAWIAALGVAA
jgi:hypothetical protein